MQFAMQLDHTEDGILKDNGLSFKHRKAPHIVSALSWNICFIAKQICNGVGYIVLFLIEDGNQPRFRGS